MKRRVTTTVLSPRDRDGYRSGSITVHEHWFEFDTWGYYTRSITLSLAWLRNHPARYGFAA